MYFTDLKTIVVVIFYTILAIMRVAIYIVLILLNVTLIRVVSESDPNKINEIMTGTIHENNFQLYYISVMSLNISLIIMDYLFTKACKYLKNQIPTYD